MADNLFYVVTGVAATQLHIHRSAVPARKKAGTLCGVSTEAWVMRPTDKDVQSLPICENCQEIFDDHEDGLAVG